MIWRILFLAYGVLLGCWLGVLWHMGCTSHYHSLPDGMCPAFISHRLGDAP